MSGDYDDIPPEDPYMDGPAKIDEKALTEQSVLGAMMLAPTAVVGVLPILRAEDFSVPRHELVFEALAALYAAGAPTDVIAVTDHLISTGDLQRAGGADYLHTLTSVVPTPSAAKYYASIVRSTSIGRQAAEVGERLRDKSTSGNAAAAIDEAATALRKIVDDGAPADDRVRWMRDVLDVPAHEDEYDWVIPDVLERQDRLMLSAGEGVGKSTLLRQFATLSAAGIHPFRFHQIPPVRVLVVDAENSERQWRRATRDLAAQAEQRGVRDPRGNIGLQCVGVMDITKPHDLGRLHKWMDEADPHMVVLGPLYRMVGGNPMDKDTDVAPVLAALESIRERNVAMLIEVHAGHARSTSGERELRPRGSSALLGWPEFGLGLRRNKERSYGRTTYSLVRWRGDRDRREWPTLTRGPGQIWPWEPTVG